MQAWARLIRKRGFNMAGKENQWDLRVEYGWGRCVLTHTHRRIHTDSHGHTERCTHVPHTHEPTHTHTHTRKSSTASHWHMPRQLFTVTSNYICKTAPQDSTSL